VEPVVEVEVDDDEVADGISDVIVLDTGKHIPLCLIRV
jgi:hypothetical protein